MYLHSSSISFVCNASGFGWKKRTLSRAKEVTLLNGTGHCTEMGIGSESSVSQSDSYFLPTDFGDGGGGGKPWSVCMYCKMYITFTYLLVTAS